MLSDLLLKTIPDWQALAQELSQQLSALEGDTEGMMNLLREVHHAQLFHLLAYDLQGDMSMESLADHLSALAEYHCGRDRSGCLADDSQSSSGCAEIRGDCVWKAGRQGVELRPPILMWYSCMTMITPMRRCFMHDWRNVSLPG